MAGEYSCPRPLMNTSQRPTNRKVGKLPIFASQRAIATCWTPIPASSGSSPTSVDRLFGGSCCDGERILADGGFELDGGEPAERALAATSVVRAFDPGDDCQAKLFACLPDLAVEHVLLQEREARFRRCGVAGGRNAAHGFGEPVSTQGPQVPKRPN